MAGDAPVPLSNPWVRTALVVAAAATGWAVARVVLTGEATVVGALAGGDNSFHAGSGDTEIVGGWGNDRFVAGLGDSTIMGGPGKDVYAFIKGASGGHDIIWGFDSNDEIVLEGYGKGAVKAALSSQVQVSGGVQITLTDSTTVTFMGLSQLSKSDFG